MDVQRFVQQAYFDYHKNLFQLSDDSLLKLA